MSASPLEDLRSRLKSQREQRHLDIPLLDVEPEIGVRYHAIPHRVIEKAYTKRERSKNPDRTVLANAEILVQACTGVYQVEDGEKVSVDPDASEWPDFGPRLAEILGVEENTAVGVCRALYGEGGEGELIAAAMRLTKFSGYVTDELAEWAEGN